MDKGTLKKKVVSIFSVLLGVGFVLAYITFYLFTLKPPNFNRFEAVIADVAESKGWKLDDIEMLNGSTRSVASWHWTRVEFVVRSASVDEPVYVTARKLPLLSPWIGCHSVGKRCST